MPTNSGSVSSNGQSLPRRRRRPKILCLGVSYPDLQAHLSSVDANGDVATLITETRCGAGAICAVKEDESLLLSQPQTAQTLTHCDSHVAAIDCVQRGRLTQMDGRDLARCLATEEYCNVDVYGVSQEQGAVSYRQDRHFEANFNRSQFVQKLQQHFKDCRFDQIILDYYWIPTGWDTAHWRPSFFHTTLVHIATSRLLQSSPASATRASCQSPTATLSSHFHAGRYRRGVYVPFCLHCFAMIVAHQSVLLPHYNISFLRKSDLSCLTLWVGTQQIDARRMQHVLGKRRDQEEVYCTFGPRHVQGASMESSSSGKNSSSATSSGNVGSNTNDLVSLASSLEDFADIRFILLEPLPQHAMARSLTLGSMRQQKMRKVAASKAGATTAKTKPVMGRFLGLVHPSLVQRGFAQQQRQPFVVEETTTTTATAPTITSSRRGGRHGAVAAPVVTPPPPTLQSTRRRPSTTSSSTTTSQASTLQKRKRSLFAKEIDARKTKSSTRNRRRGKDSSFTASAIGDDPSAVDSDDQGDAMVQTRRRKPKPRALFC